MAPRPTKPIDQYPAVAPHEQPPVPPLDPAPIAATPTAEASASPGRTPAAKLTFRATARPLSEDVPLEFPFEWEARLVETVTVRRLTVAEVGGAADDGSFEADGLWAIYAAQTGLPVAVLRGLIEDDGDRVTETCRRFLPRAFAAMLDRSDDGATSSSPTPASGALTSGA